MVLIAAVLSVLLGYTDSDCLFGIFKLFRIYEKAEHALIN
jgi:hypothetical protein